jgi:type I restriction enzyme S subunit
MVEGLKPYSEYKPALLKWTDAVPSHWEVKRPKTFLVEIEDRSTTGTETLLSMRMQSGLVPFKQVSTKIIPPQNLIGYKRTQPGDIVLNRMQASNGMFARTIEPGIVSPDYAVLRPTAKVDVRYVTYLFKTPVMRARFRGESKGLGTGTAGFLRLYSDRLFAMNVVFPPVEEQTAIADFLDSHAVLLTKFIRTKRRQIELLNEQKAAVTLSVITRGRAGNTLADSGVQWLGNIPSHWEVRRLKYITRFENGIAFKPGDWKDSGVPIIRIENLNGSEEFNYTTREDLPANLLIEPGDLLFAWSGNKGTSFGSFIWDRPFHGYLNQHIFKLTGYRCDKRFFYYLLRAVTRHVEERTHGIIGLVHITKPELGAVSVPVPPEAEQIEIASQLDELWADIDTAIRQCQRQIEQVREYSKRLIGDAVTGAVDVRDVSLRISLAEMESVDAEVNLAEAEDALCEPEEVPVGDE